MKGTARHRHHIGRSSESGAALITALLCMALLLALALALLLSTTTDTLISNSYRSSSEAFFAADGGIAMGRRALQSALNEQIVAIRDQKAQPYKPNQILPDTGSAPSHPFFQAISTRFGEIANVDNRSVFSNGAKYQVELVAFEGGPTALRDPQTGLETYSFRYTIRSQGRSERGARSQVEEHGELTTKLNAFAKPNRQPFSKFGTFFGSGSDGKITLVSGIFTGPVHTNSHFAFSSKNTVQFTDKVTQVDDFIEYDGQHAGVPGNGTQGIIVSNGEYRQSPRIPPPANNYSQELATIDASGRGEGPDGSTIPPGTRPPADALAAGLTDVNGNNPGRRGNRLSQGVYVGSSDGATVTGGGIYVSGDAEVQLTTNGNTQTIQVTQGGTQTTITLDYGGNRTTISSGGQSRSFTGVPTDGTQFAGDGARPGTSLFVDGSITSLSGPRSANGSTQPAIAPQTSMTITAQRHIRVTGDIKYTESVINPDGTASPAAATLKSSLGIFTNDGNLELAPDPNKTDGGRASLEIDAAIAVFDNNPANNGGGKEGTIVYAGDVPPGPDDRLTIVGSRVQANIAIIGYRNRAVYFDPRLAGGAFAPPFFPGIDVTTTPGDLKIQYAGEQAIRVFADSWQRDERRRRGGGA